MTTLYGLHAQGLLAITGEPGQILHGKVYAERDAAHDAIPTFKAACSTTPAREPASLRDLMEEGLEVAIIEFELVSERVEFYRAGGGAVCDTCGSPYRQHPPYRKPEGLGGDGQPFLRRLCDGRLVKL